MKKNSGENKEKTTIDAKEEEEDEHKIDTFGVPILIYNFKILIFNYFNFIGDIFILLVKALAYSFKIFKRFNYKVIKPIM